MTTRVTMPTRCHSSNLISCQRHRSKTIKAETDNILSFAVLYLGLWIFIMQLKLLAKLYTS